MKLGKTPIWILLPTILLLLFVGLSPALATPDPRDDLNDIESALGATSADTTWDDGSATVNLVDKLRGLAGILLVIALVVAALYAGITGKTTMAIFVAAGGVVLYGGFWIVLLVIENLGGTVPASNNVDYDMPIADFESPLSKIIKSFIGYGINILTTATMPFLMIYGFWLSLGIASGTGGDNAGPIKNYVTGAVVALGAAIFTQIFFRWPA